jgi:hypothetical protein
MNRDGSAKTEAAEGCGLRRKRFSVGPRPSPGDPHCRADPRNGKPHSERKANEKVTHHYDSFRRRKWGRKNLPLPEAAMS